MDIQKSKMIHGDVCSDDVWAQIDKLEYEVPLFVCEGLMRYLDKRTKETLANKIFNRLGLNGLWVTCDLTLSEMLEQEKKSSDIKDDEVADTVYDQNSNSFSSVADCMNFFRNFGFEVKYYSAEEALEEIGANLSTFDAENLKLASKFVNVLALSRTT